MLLGAGADAASVPRVTIGFQAVSALAAGRVDAVTAFWNAEGVALRRQGIPTRVFRVDDYGAPRYPELWLCTSTKILHDDPQLVRHVRKATVRGYRFELGHPQDALDDLLAGSSGLDRGEQHAQLGALLSAHAVDPGRSFDSANDVRKWLRWESDHGIVKGPLERPPGAMFAVP